MVLMTSSDIEWSDNEDNVLYISDSEKETNSMVSVADSENVEVDSRYCSSKKTQKFNLELFKH